VSKNQGGIEKSRITSYPAAAYGTAAAVIAVMIVRKFFWRPTIGPPLAMKNQNLSPSIHAVGPGEILISSCATVLLPAPTGPESRTIDPMTPPAWPVKLALGKALRKEIQRASQAKTDRTLPDWPISRH
jgi:hypothetical protein